MKKLLVFVLISIASYSYAKPPEVIWGATGHRVVGEIAEQYLSSKTERALKKLLDGQSLAFVSTFADDIKSDKRYNKFYTWHFINIPLDANYEASEKHPDGDLVSGINYCISVIKNPESTKADKAFYLKLLVHFVGDLHQPMHIGLAEDKGGNDFKLQWFYRDSNLHRVWDSDMIENNKMSYTELANNANVLTKKEVKAIQEGSVIDWVNEVHQITRHIYSEVEENDNLRYRYAYDNFGTVRTQLQKAGIRLAKILNDLF